VIPQPTLPSAVAERLQSDEPSAVSADVLGGGSTIADDAGDIPRSTPEEIEVL